MSIANNEAALYEKFGLIDDSQERLSAVVDWARRRPRAPAEVRTPANRIMGCASPVWLSAACEGGRLNLCGDAESPIVKGLLTLLCEVYQGEEAGVVYATETQVFERLGLLRDLSATRQHGLAAVRFRLRELARGFMT